MWQITKTKKKEKISHSIVFVRVAVFQRKKLGNQGLLPLPARVEQRRNRVSKEAKRKKKQAY